MKVAQLIPIFIEAGPMTRQDAYYLSWWLIGVFIASFIGGLITRFGIKHGVMAREWLFGLTVGPIAYMVASLFVIAILGVLGKL